MENFDKSCSLCKGCNGIELSNIDKEDVVLVHDYGLTLSMLYIVELNGKEYQICMNAYPNSKKIVYEPWIKVANDDKSFCHYGGFETPEAVEYTHQNVYDWGNKIVDSHVHEINEHYEKCLGNTVKD